MKVSTLRPGLLVSLKTSVRGNTNYIKRVIEGEHTVETGEQLARWETTRVITDPAEHEQAKKAREAAGTLIRGICSASAFGLLCPEAKTQDLEAAIAQARQIADDFNATAKLSRINIYVITGRIAPDDVEAVRAINAEVRELMESMQTGLRNLDVKVVREAANKARGLSQMLQPEAQERIKLAIDTAREVARRIIKAGEQGAVEIDRAAIAKINEQRTAFLDLDAAPVEIGTVGGDSRAIDLSPEADCGVAEVKAAPIPAIELGA